MDPMPDPAAPQDDLIRLLMTSVAVDPDPVHRQRLRSALRLPSDSVVSNNEIEAALRAALLPRETPGVVRPVQGAPSEEAFMAAVRVWELSPHDQPYTATLRNAIKAAYAIDARSSKCECCDRPARYCGETHPYTPPVPAPSGCMLDHVKTSAQLKRVLAGNSRFNKLDRGIVGMVIDMLDCTSHESPLRPINEAELVHGRDAAYWHESYRILVNAVDQCLPQCVHGDDIAEEAIYMQAIQEAGNLLRSSPPAKEEGPDWALVAELERKGWLLRLNREARDWWARFYRFTGVGGELYRAEQETGSTAREAVNRAASKVRALLSSPSPEGTA